MHIYMYIHMYIAPLRPNITDPVLHCDIPLVNSDGRPVELQWMVSYIHVLSYMYMSHLSFKNMCICVCILKIR